MYQHLSKDKLMTKEEFLKFLGNPKVHSVKITSVGKDRYRGNVFMSVKTPECIVEKISLTDSYYVEYIDGIITDLTLRA